MSETFDALLAERLADPEFARSYAADTARIAAIDAVVNQLDDAREASNLTKARLARAIGSHPRSASRMRECWRSTRFVASTLYR